MNLEKEQSGTMVLIVSTDSSVSLLLCRCSDKAMFIENVSSSWTNRSNHSDVSTIKTGAADMEENGSERRRGEISEKPYRRRGADKIGPKM